MRVPFRVVIAALVPLALIACDDDEAADAGGDANKAAAVEACPTTTTELRERTEPLVCSCPPSKAGYGVVFGSGPYLDGSGICMAARHAGLLKEEDVVLKLQMIRTTEKLTASEANGVKTAEPTSDGSEQIAYTLELN